MSRTSATKSWEIKDLNISGFHTKLGLERIRMGVEYNVKLFFERSEDFVAAGG
jgi:hypothetical protein